MDYQNSSIFDFGQVLYTPMYTTVTYLIDKNGDIDHTWQSDYFAGEAVYMLSNSFILRTKKLTMAYAGAGGGVQNIDWSGAIIWDFNYYSDDHLSHHDIKPLPNGNVLMIAWEFKTRNEAIAAGRDPTSFFDDKLMPEHVIEVQPSGPTNGEIVWEWHSWDHLIQDYDPAKDNYGIVGDHPELIDINYGPMVDDWLHCNSIDYNEEFDQLLLSIPNFNEIWVIDHSTTTEEAASHSGGNSGMGGDLLYRWGNPQAYDAGTINDQKLFGQHDATWIEPGLQGEGNILVFNNGVNRPSVIYSSVDEIIPPVDDNGNYYLDPEFYYGPEELTWSYTADNPTDFFATYISGAQRLPNGNTLICDGSAGWFFEVTPEKEIVWEYINPYPNPQYNDVFKIQYIPSEEIPPCANFIYNPINPKRNEIIQFNDTSTDDEQIISWFWDFGDGNISTEKNPTHKYTEIGTYTVTLSIIDNDALLDEISKNINVVLNNPPNIPYNPEPENGETNVDVNTILIWECNDPNEDDLIYDVYFGTNSNPPLVSQGQPQIYYDPPGQMNYETQYFWKIIAWDSYNATTPGPIWNFTTGSEAEPNNPPYTPSNPYPIDGATKIPININLNWTGGDPDEENNVVYDVYLEANNPNPTIKVSDDQEETSYNAKALEPNTIYYWRIHAKDNHNVVTIGPIWNFTTEKTDNHPPSIPNIDGPTSGDFGKSIIFTFNAIDPDNDDLRFIIEWGDGNSNTTDFVSSEKTISIPHTWNKARVFTIKVIAEDTNGLISPASTFEITIPHIKNSNNYLFFNFFLRFINLFPIIQKVLNSFK